MSLIGVPGSEQVRPIPEFCRGPIWASQAAQAEWEVPLREYARVWQEIELESVRQATRASALLNLTPAELLRVTDWAARADSVVVPLEETSVSDGYAAGSTGLGASGLRIAVMRQQKLALEWIDAWQRKDDARIAGLLGYPPCCAEFFSRTWGAGLRDTTLAQAESGVDGPPECSVLLRWIGVRLVPHLPCSYSCRATELLGQELAAIGRALGHARLVRKATEALAWPTSYSSLHGIGVVSTPALRVEFSTDYFAEKREFRRAAIELPPDTLGDFTPWEDCGFASPDAMRSAHAVIVAAAGSMKDDALDLGCGDGSLLAVLCEKHRITRGRGIDSDAGRIERGAARYPDLKLEVGTIERWADGADCPSMIMLMPGRLLEMPEYDRGRVRAEVLRRARKSVLVYAYGDWLRDGGLESLCVRAGLPVPTRVVRGARGMSAGAGVILKTDIQR